MTSFIYCDGSIERSTMVGRIAVVIPDLDYGHIEQFHQNVRLPNGMENSLYAEEFAIMKADSIRTQIEREHGGALAILSDNRDAIRNVGLRNVELIPYSSLHYADAYLKKLIQRLGYLRRSEGKVTRRKTITPVQAEVALLARSSNLDFHLSKSPLFSLISQ